MNPFVIYRLPGHAHPVMEVATEVIHLGRLQDISTLHGKYFLFAPFASEDDKPVLAFRTTPQNLTVSDLRDFLFSDLSSDEQIHLFCSDEQIHSFSSDEQMDDSYKSDFQTFMSVLENGQFSKLVLSRRESEPVPEGFDPIEVYLRACSRYPSMMVTMVYSPEIGIWIGCTPEIIIKGKGENWETMALAGTMSADSYEDAKRADVMKKDGLKGWSEKNIEEQAYVSRFIRSVIKRYSNQIRLEGPYVASAGHLRHLRTDFYFEAKASNLGEILADLHPTPAVCGLPQREAFDFILKNESCAREYYSGVLGPVDSEGETALFVNLRCMKVAKGEINYFAGGGILAASEVESEWRETQEKMKTLKSCVHVDE